MEIDKESPLSREKASRGKPTSSAHRLESQIVLVYTYVTGQPFDDPASAAIKDPVTNTSAKGTLQECFQRPC